MPRLIDADELYVDARCGENEEPYISLYQINDAPTVDAEPVRHGHNTGEGVRWFRCSECGWGFNDIYMTDESNIDSFPNYCPNCGAKMDEVEDG